MSSEKKKIQPLKKPGGPAEREQSPPVSRTELELLMKKAREMAQGAPQKAAIILTDWLKRPRRLDNIREDAKPSQKKKAG